MYPDLKGKIAVVTGAGKRTGIGFAIAAKLAQSGANVVLADLGALPFDDTGVAVGRREEMDELAAELAEQHGVETLAVDLNVSDAASIAAMVEAVREKFGQVDILCNNAGASFGVPNMVHTYDEDAWMKTIDVNLHGVFRMTRALLPMMFGRPASIVNTASRAGKVPPVFNGAYAVAKAGVIMLTKVMARELGGMGIRVNAVCPGQIDTDLERWRFGLEADALGGTIEDRKKEMEKTIPLQRIGKPEDAASVVAFLASEASSYLTGQAINITGGQLMEL
ncbi:MAG: SDR family NAD(P)-dependent oxidoreductase [Candidatus Lernaella stagnicola]|nr:SDR family NAD(P)-dependent oxidoreductase [Candidatus Lernaella stagnicola]